MLFKNAVICAIEPETQTVAPFKGHVLIDQGKIERFFSEQETSLPDTETDIDLHGRVLTVPNVNFHEHIYSRLAKGLPINGPMDNFVHILQTLWWKLDRFLDLDMVQASAELTVLEAVRHGVTYLFDHHASPAPDAVKGSLQRIADTLQKAGLRGVLAFEVSDRNGAGIARESIAENAEFAAAQTSEIKAMMGLHAPFTLSDETLRRVADVVRGLELGIHIHVAEDRADVEHTRKEHGLSIARRLQSFNLLNERSLLIHGVHLGDEDYRIIREHGAALAYNPDSNLNNAVGLPHYAAVPKEIPVLAGTDGMHANVVRSLKQLFLLYRHQGNSFDKAFAWLQKIFFDQLRFVRRYFPDFPLLRQGDRADFIVWDYVPPTPFTAENFWGHYIYAMTEAPIYSVVQNGELLLHERNFTRLDEKALQENIIRQGHRLYERFKTK
jgi:putative selenium metabolism protein SsnA